MILYQTALSTYSLKVRLALALKGASADLREPPGGSYRSAEYRALIPAATVPALVDGDLVLSESDAIVEYIDEVATGPRILPQDVRSRARARMLSRLIDMRLEASMRRLFPALKEGRSLTDTELAPTIEALGLLSALADSEGPFACGAEPALPDCGMAANLVWADLLVPPVLRTTEPVRLQRWRSAIRAEPRWIDLLSGYETIAAAWVRSTRA